MYMYASGVSIRDNEKRTLLHLISGCPPEDDIREMINLLIQQSVKYSDHYAVHVHVYCMSYGATWKYPLLAYAHACTRGKAIYFICRCYQHKYIVVSQANAHSWGVSAHVPHFKGPL